MNKKSRICEFAYSRVEIVGMTGEVTFCCPSYTDFYILGNLHEQSFEEIWNGKRAKKMRQSMLDGSFKYCHTDMCCSDNELLIPPPPHCTSIAPPPKIVEIGVSTICNCLCTMCRNEPGLMDAEMEVGFYDKMLSKYLPILEHAEILSLNNYGEVFVDKNCKRLIKKACAINKNLRLKILTNGVFADEKRFKEYGIMDRVDSISVSVHAVTKNTYDSIVRNGNFEKVQKNVEWLAKMKSDGKINNVTINFVVQQKNYQEMIAFAKWAEKLKIECDFWEVRLDKDNAEIWDKNDSPEHLKDVASGACSYDISEYYKAAVHLQNHPEHSNLIKIVKNPIFKKKFCNINDLLLNDNVCT